MSHLNSVGGSLFVIPAFMPGTGIGRDFTFHGNEMTHNLSLLSKLSGQLTSEFRRWHCKQLYFSV